MICIILCARVTNSKTKKPYTLVLNETALYGIRGFVVFKNCSILIFTWNKRCDENRSFLLKNNKNNTILLHYQLQFISINKKLETVRNIFKLIKTKNIYRKIEFLKNKSNFYSQLNYFPQDNHYDYHK